MGACVCTVWVGACMCVLVCVCVCACLAGKVESSLSQHFYRCTRNESYIICMHLQGRI